MSETIIKNGLISAVDMPRARQAVNGGTHGLTRFKNAYNSILRALETH